MGATQIVNAAAGEDLIGIGPALLQQADAGWLERLNLFTGRTLSDVALQQEQNYRSGRSMLLGQAVTQGVVHGLDLSVDLTAKDPSVTVAPGYGLAATGQDVNVLRTMTTKLSALAVIDIDKGIVLAPTFGEFTPPAGQPWAGILLLQGVLASVPGSEVDTSFGNVVSGNLFASCSQDPSEYPFSDPQIVDAAQLVFATWPSTLAMPAAAPASSWRNRLVYTVFNAEQALRPDERMPWEYLGVPLALAGFDAASKLLFVDRSAVVRAGGLPRRRFILPVSDAQQNLVAVQPALANARVSQFAEQVGETLTPPLPPGLIVDDFALLPPGGILPSYTMDFTHKVALWCPSNWAVTAAPVYLEEVEGALQSGITAAPLDTAQPESIEILVPLPARVYDPGILVTEVVAPVFQQEVLAAMDARNLVLRRRKVIEEEASALDIAAAQPAIDLSAGLNADEIAARDGTPIYTPAKDETFATELVGSTYRSLDVDNLVKAASAAPYTVTYHAPPPPPTGTSTTTTTTTTPIPGGTPAPPPFVVITLPLFTPQEISDLQTNGLQKFITYINAKVERASDLLDLAFLTAQTDIYRYRQNVLNATDATRLAVSPILANIATGVTATATAQNIHDYLSSIKPAPTASTTTTTTPSPLQFAARGFTKAAVAPRVMLSATGTATGISPVLLQKAPASPVKSTISETASVAAKASNLGISATVASGVFTPVVVGTAAEPANPIDVTGQSPIVGAQLDLRTLSIGERLAQSPPQEALFYAVANRLSFLALLTDLDIAIDDLPLLVDNLPNNTVPPTVSDLRPTAARYQLAIGWVQSPQIKVITNSDPDESLVFSTGVRALEQHSQLLRALEGRVQLYRDFAALCTTALANVQSNLQSANSLVAQLNNDLTLSRQNLAYTQTLLADETARVNSVNQTRIDVLNTYVQFIAYNRPRTVVNRPSVQSRQLVPITVDNPAPACAKQTMSVPPELREIVALLREAPVRWFPPILKRLPSLERPALLQGLASDLQSRAQLLVSQPLAASSAAASTGRFAPAIAKTYAANQQVLRTIQTARSSFQPATLLTQSWSANINLLVDVAAVADLQTSSVVHAEISSAATSTIQQISSVATCLYTRIGQALPIDRLNWAQFLESNPSTSLRNLSALPGWNSQNYIDRQQMQLLVEWLFQQVDGENATAQALMNDLVVTAILLATDAPVDSIIAGAVASRTIPVIGNPIRLTLPSDRVAHGMYVNLFSAGVLTARAVVSDLDTSGVTATVTDIYQPNPSLAANDIAHYTAKAPNAVVYKAFS